MALGKIWSQAQAEACRANGSWVTVHCLRATRTRVDADTIHIAPRETYIKNVLDILGLGDNKCKSMPTPIDQTRQKSDEHEPTFGEEDRRAYHRSIGISDISESTAQTSLLQSMRSARHWFLLGTQKLGIMIRKSKDPEHLDAYTDADWNGDSIDGKSTSGGILKIGSATMREFTKVVKHYRVEKVSTTLH